MKRARADDKTIKKAIAISRRINAKYPYSTYGRAYLQRGTAENIGRFGETFKSATAEQKAMRKQMGYVGRGLYTGRGGYWMQKLFGAKPGGWLDKAGDIGAEIAGRTIPGYDLALRGATMAHKAYTGQGEYVASNQLVSGAANTFQVPSFAPSQDGASVVISHKEYVANVYAPGAAGAFTNKSYQINPGLEELFPWLSQIAVNYEEYDLKQCMITFRSTVSDFNSGTGQCGQVIMATQYNPSLEPFSDKLTMMSYDSAQSSKTTEHQVHGVECDPRKLSGSPGKYVRWQPLDADQDVKEYDHAQFNIAISDIPSTFANQSMGELWISYTVELRKPKLVVNKALSVERELFLLLSNSGGSMPLAPRLFSQPLLGLSTQSRYVKYGANNSIGISVSPGASYASPAGLVQATRFLFPAGYGGTLQVKVHVVLENPGVNLTVNGLSGNINTGCNISTISDNPTCDNTGAFYASTDNTNVFDMDGGVAPNNLNSLVFLQHIDVKPVTSGKENWIDYYVSFGQNVAQNYFMVEVDIMEYNSSFRQKLNGSNNTLKLVDVDGNIVTYP